MSWTWRAGPAMLRLYPEISDMPKLMDAWPSLREAVEAGPDAPAPPEPVGHRIGGDASGDAGAE